MTGTDPRGHDASVDTIQRELTAFARRARATAARLHPELPLVSYTLLAHIDDSQGCRATDLAAHYMLDKSTVSRQLAVLEKLGLVERRPAADDQRVQVLHPTEAGDEETRRVPGQPARGRSQPAGGLERRGPRPLRDLPAAVQLGGVELTYCGATRRS